MRRIAVIEKDKCNPQGCGGHLCIRVSPGNRMGNEVFVIGADGKAQVNEDVCTDAESITVKKCPFGAIHMVKLPEKLTEKPIHRFGVDGFSLFSLPVPLFGQVNGILGINGIGKSTAVKVVAQMLQPNFGMKEAAAAGKAGSGKKPVDKLIQMFKGSEAQVFFEKVRDGKITVSVKPQAVDAIPKTFKGTAKQLLQKVCNDEKKIASVARELGISNVLETDISKVSGGELQRAAIAAAVLKNSANVYLFDEPTSYLDIKQRIKISSFIRKLATPETSVVAVEHDLIILDYMADSVHIMYGEAGAYGISAQPKPTRAAINTYLEGYIREDNMRFRQHEIKFEAKPPQKVIGKECLVKWDGISKKLGRFQLTASAGELPRKHVIGVLGENGLGKTSFVKLLTGEIKPDSGSIHIGMRPMAHSANGEIVSANIRISYKPQYIHATEKPDEQVTNMLAKAQNDAQLMARLELEPLLLKKVSELSGGELQRVMIAKCLAEDADLYLLDEPSAYLDVEQRIAVSKLLRERIGMHGKTALVVDHDLLLVDYVADMIMVFEGQPAVSGEAHGPFTMEEGMNHFLKSLGITLRRDKDSNRPRINSPGSRLEREQKAEGRYYYS